MDVREKEQSKKQAGVAAGLLKRMLQSVLEQFDPGLLESCRINVGCRGVLCVSGSDAVGVMAGTSDPSGVGVLCCLAVYTAPQSVFSHVIV